MRKKYKKFKNIEEKIGIKFDKFSLLVQAFCHRSYLNENPDFDLNHNERLEFLGDAVMELVVTEHLFLNYPEKLEGELTDWRAALVNTKMISEVAQGLGLSDYLLLSNGERKGCGRARRHMLADTFESLIGAIYVDSGYEKTKGFIEKNLIEKKLPRIISLELFKDPKSELQEIAQEKTGITPEYKVLSESGPDHNKCFLIGVFLEDKKLAQGSGNSKKEAEEKAAKKALEKNY